jgi:preprotein translocase SecE subunit
MSAFPVTSKPVVAGAPKVGPSAGPAFPKGLTEWPAYLMAVKSEWGRITWPTQMQIVGLTGIVVVMVTIMTLILWGMDSVLRLAVDFIKPH